MGAATLSSHQPQTGTFHPPPLGRLPVPAGTPDGPAGLVIRPGALSPDPAGRLSGVVRSGVFQGDHHRLTVDLGGIDVEVVTRDARVPGASVRLRIDPEEVVVLGG